MKGGRGGGEGGAATSVAILKLDPRAGAVREGSADSRGCARVGDSPAAGTGSGASSWCQWSREPMLCAGGGAEALSGRLPTGAPGGAAGGGAIRNCGVTTVLELARSARSAKEPLPMESRGASFSGGSGLGGATSCVAPAPAAAAAEALLLSWELCLGSDAPRPLPSSTSPFDWKTGTATCQSEVALAQTGMLRHHVWW